jgi:formylglycine-generating enzyme
MVCIPAGAFTRGNNSGNDNEKPEAQIDLDEFYIDQYEVMNRFYRECVDKGVCTLQRMYNIPDYNTNIFYDNYPVVGVTWDQARQYCEFLGKRLPTENEWEKAARGPDGYIYPWGNEMIESVQISLTQRTGTVKDGSTAEDVSEYGVYDMAGNVREWVNDDYGGAGRKVVRGGSWGNHEADFWSVTKREGYLSENAFGEASSARDLGFRCFCQTETASFDHKKARQFDS